MPHVAQQVGGSVEVGVGGDGGRAHVAGEVSLRVAPGGVQGVEVTLGPPLAPLRPLPASYKRPLRNLPARYTSARQAAAPQPAPSPQPLHRSPPTPTWCMCFHSASSS